MPLFWPSVSHSNNSFKCTLSIGTVSIMLLVSMLLISVATCTQFAVIQKHNTVLCLGCGSWRNPVPPPRCTAISMHDHLRTLPSRCTASVHSRTAVVVHNHLFAVCEPAMPGKSRTAQTHSTNDPAEVLYSHRNPVFEEEVRVHTESPMLADSLISPELTDADNILP